MRRVWSGINQRFRPNTDVRWAFAVALVLALPGHPARAGDEERARLEKYVDFDQNYNVLRRKRTDAKAAANTFTAEQKADRELAYFKVSTANPLVRFFGSESLTPAEKAALIHTDEAGKTFHLLPILKKDEALYKLCRTFLGKPLAVEVAKKLLGRTTHAAYGNAVIAEDFFVKWIPPMPGRNMKGRRALMTNDYLERGQHLLPEHLRGHVINDVATLEIRLGPTTAAIGYRSTRKITNPLAGGTVYPGHGLLGCDECVARLAKAKGMTVRKWKNQHFLPKLAELTAYSHFVLGAFYETHTQNLLIEVDEKTGEILKLYVRDLSDVSIDPIVRLARGDASFASREGVKTLPLVVHHLFADPDVPLAREAGENVATYTLQSVGSHLKGFQARAKDSILFLKYYRESYAKIFGKEATISPTVESLIDEQEKLIAESKARNLAKRSGETVTDELVDEIEDAAEDEADELSRGKLRKKMIAEGIQDVFDQGKRELVRSLALKVDVAEDQKLLREKFGKALLNQELTFGSAEARNRVVPKAYQDWKKAHSRYLTGLKPRVGKILDGLSFGELPDGQVAAFDKESGELLAVTLHNERPFGWAERWKCLLWLR